MIAPAFIAHWRPLAPWATDHSERGPTAEIAAALGVSVRLLPLTDHPVRTRVQTPGGWLGFQEYFVREKALAEALGRFGVVVCRGWDPAIKLAAAPVLLGALRNAASPISRVASASSPKGTCSVAMMPTLTPTMPYSSASPTRQQRPISRLKK